MKLKEIVAKPIEDIVVTKGVGGVEKKPRPEKEQALNCPRCHSINTKFCYYNNYSLTQPRYFCKTCRRYWTEGGSLRNIPVGGGSRKNKRSFTSSNSTPNTINSTNKKLPDLVITRPTLSHTQNPKNNDNIVLQGQDLNLAFPAATTISEFIQQNNNSSYNMSASASSSTTTSITTATTSTTATTAQLSALELLTGITSSSSNGLNSFMPVVPADSNSVYTCGFPLQDFKSTLNFSLDGTGNGYTSLQNAYHQSGRLLFPFEDLKQVSSNTNTMDQKQQGDSTGYWTGMLGGGSW